MLKNLIYYLKNDQINNYNSFILSGILKTWPSCDKLLHKLFYHLYFRLKNWTQKNQANTKTGVAGHLKGYKIRGFMARQPKWFMARQDNLELEGGRYLEKKKKKKVCKKINVRFWAKKWLKTGVADRSTVTIRITLIIFK